MPSSRVAAGAGALAVAAVVTLAAVAPGAPPDPARARPEKVVTADGADFGYVVPLPGELLGAFDPPGVPWGSGHRGVDLAGADGETVVAAGDGVVAFAGVVVDRPVLSIDHADGIRTTYEPVVAVVVRGERVRAGQTIGTSTTAGGHCAPAACLHWGARVGEVYLDPMSLLGDRRVRLYPVAGVPRAAPGVAGGLRRAGAPGRRRNAGARR